MKTERDDILKAVIARAANEVDQAEIFSLESGNISIGFRNGVLREMEESQDAGFCLRVINNGRIAQTTTSNMDRALETVDQALELLPFGEQVTYSFPAPLQTGTLAISPKPDKNLDHMVSQSQSIIDRMRAYDSSLVASAGADVTTIRVNVMNSNGVNSCYERTTQTVSAVAILAEEGNILTTYRFYMGQQGFTDPERLAEEVIELVRMGRTNVPFSGASIPILFTPHAMADIFAAFGAGINGAAVAKGMSPLTGKIGEQILNKQISIVDDGLFPHATGSQIIDDEGIPCRKNFLVENGILKNYLLDLNSAAKLGMEPSGNGFRYTALIKSRSYAAVPGPAFTNLFLPPGTRSRRDILSSSNRMLLVDQLTGVLLGNLINGDWSGNIEYGILFENGQPVGRIKNAMTGGNFYTMFMKNYSESSSEREWVSGFGGGAGSSFFPYILFEGLNVSA
ncbi:TldD/PmbA family protein [bacterium]|nr:TldD/PmbA family protein [candidate division CSSED10-310 bacterium]